jgi:hypothetical protein
MSKRSLYALVGYLAGLAPGLALYFAWKPNVGLVTTLPLFGMVIALWWGERTHKIPTADEMNRPVTLFGKDPVPPPK